MNQTIQIILQGGALGVLVLLLGGIGYLLLRSGPKISAFFTGLLEELKANREVSGGAITALAALTVEIRNTNTVVLAEIRNTNGILVARLDLVEERLRAHVIAVGNQVEDVVRQRSSNTTTEIGQTVDRVVGLFTRQPTDPEMMAVVEERLAKETPARGFPPISRSQRPGGR